MIVHKIRRFVTPHLSKPWCTLFRENLSSFVESVRQTMARTDIFHIMMDMGNIHSSIMKTPQSEISDKLLLFDDSNIAKLRYGSLLGKLIIVNYY